MGPGSGGYWRCDLKGRILVPSSPNTCFLAATRQASVSHQVPRPCHFHVGTGQACAESLKIKTPKKPLPCKCQVFCQHSGKVTNTEIVLRLRVITVIVHDQVVQRLELVCRRSLERFACDSRESLECYEQFLMYNIDWSSKTRILVEKHGKDHSQEISGENRYSTGM